MQEIQAHDLTLSVEVLTAGIRPGESAWEFGRRAADMLNEAVRLSREISGNFNELNRWMVVADRLRLGVVQGYAFAIENMRPL